MYSSIIFIQYLSIVVLFIEAWVVFRKWNSRLHSYLFFGIVANIVNNIGYLFELKAQSLDNYLTALQLSYAGRVWTGFALFVFVLELCRIRLPDIVKIILALFNAVTYVIILTVRSHKLYYTELSFKMNGQFPSMEHGSGIWHKLYMGVLVCYIICGLTILFIKRHKEKDIAARKRMQLVIFAMLTESAFFLIQIFGPDEFTNLYDVTMLGSALGTLFMLASIFRYNLLDAEQLAKDYILDKMSEGIVAADPQGNVAYFNKPAEKLFPELKNDSSDVICRLQDAAENNKPLSVNDKIYTTRTDKLIRGNTSSGIVYMLHDNTDLYNLQTGLKQEVGRQTARADRLSLELMIALSRSVDAKDHYTNGHSGRVAEYAAEIARRMGKSQSEQEKIYEMGLVHDIGKIGVSEEILNKTSRLTDEEFAQIKKHTVIGYDILQAITEMPDLSIGARWHHEKYNGTGYPDGLAGEDIPEAARIICVADCYDAMTSKRTYSKPRTQESVRAEIVRCTGTQFDPAAAEVMLQMIDDDKDFIMCEQGGACVWKNRDKLRLITLPGDKATAVQ